jgi:S-adenosylmethionine:tRNA ribosyltransferase-isomerase
MRVDLFDFTLPDGRIATHPAEPRDSARLLHVGDALSDRIVRDLPQLLNPGDMLVFNNSRVIPARLFAQVNGKKIEILLHRHCEQSAKQSIFAEPAEDGLPRRVAPRNDGIWQCFARPAKKLKAGMVIEFAPGFAAIIEGRTGDGQVVLRFTRPKTLFDDLRAHGHMPLPPYIDRADTAQDKQSYQTMYAAHDGSVAAPTAGLHFTPELMAALSARGIQQAFVTLHVGAGTFQPVKVDDTDDHVMHQEWIELTQEAADTINAAKRAGGKVVAVGTTSLRILESVAAQDGTLAPFRGETGIFITPGYRFNIVDRLMTNFHLPKSTLFMLVSAFAGLDRMHAAYAHAITHEYRFYSYGDTSLLERFDAAT